MADFLFRILQPGERGGEGGGSRGGLTQHEKFSENFQKILNIFLACIRGGGVSRKARRMQTIKVLKKIFWYCKRRGGEGGEKAERLQK